MGFKMKRVQLEMHSAEILHVYKENGAKMQ